MNGRHMLAIPLMARRALAVLAGVALFVLCVPVAPAATGDDYPTRRPIRIVVPAGAGGITDILARIVGQRLGEAVGQQVFVENRPGAGGIIGSDIVAKATPDGYTLLMVYPSHPVNPTLYPKLPYDTIKDFAPITMVSGVTLVLLVNAALPAKNLQELIAMAKDKPGRLNYGTGGNGTLAHLGAELFRSMAGVELMHIPYKDSPQAAMAMQSGEVAMFFDTPITAMPQVKSGAVRAIGVSTKTRLATMPDVPPIADAVPGYEVIGWNGLLAPAGTPRPIVERLNTELVKILHTPSMVALLATHGLSPIGNSPDQFSAIMAADVAKWAKVIKEAGIKAN